MTIDVEKVKAEVLKHQQWWKIHRMSEERYLGERKMELLKWEFESYTKIKLKMLPWWLIDENCLEDK